MAARRAGLTVGAWCNRILREAATERLKEQQPPARLLEDTLAELVKQMQADREDRQREREELAARISAVEVRTEAQEDSATQTRGNLFTRLYGQHRRK